MKKIYPFIYKQFQCAANRCVDSCCKEWEIVIDEQTCQKYQKLNDIMGNRLRNAMVTDADGDVIFQLQHQRCPFWNQSGFCDIQTQLGESFLCHTCRLYPRISQDYGNFIEYDLSISCPEAARILLSCNPSQLYLVEEHDDIQIAYNTTYDLKIMKTLQDQRNKLFQTIKNTNHSAIFQLITCIRLIAKWNHISITPNKYNYKTDTILLFLKSLNILTKQWDLTLDRAIHSSNKTLILTYDTDLDYEIRAFVFDFFYRRYLQAAFTDNAVLIAQEMAFAVYSVLLLCSRLHLNSTEQRLRIWQLYIKEVEYDPENWDTLEWELGASEQWTLNFFESIFSAITFENMKIALDSL